MPNAILTRSCNKKCSYCFADTSSNDEMSLETFEKIVKKLAPATNEIKLLGGEPTLHSQFDKILEICEKYKLYVVVISNFLFSERIKSLLLNYIDKHPYEISFLANSTDLDTKNRMEIFRNNYNSIYEKMYQFNYEEELACGITIDENKSSQYYIEYIDFLINNLICIEKMRLSLRFPGTDKNNFYFINNHELGNKFIFITKKLMDENIPCELDCIHYPCMYSSKEEIKFMGKFVNHSNKFKCDGSFCPTDYLPDGKALYCFPCSLINVNYDEYNSHQEVKDQLSKIYNSIECSLPTECEKCIYRDICNGPCLGFYNIKE